MGKVKLILCMIVKNEANIIERCIDRAKQIISGICITDTGSTDQTKEKILAMGGKLNIPTKVYDSEFKNFGFARTKSFLNCQEFVKEQNMDPQFTYALLLDADMILEVLDTDFEKFTNVGYMIAQYNFSTEWMNLRLARLDCPWKCIGATHEYWSYDDPTNPGNPRIKHLRIMDIGDGGSKGNKYERDVKLLLDDLKENPKNARSMFYLGETYRNRPNNNKEETIAYKTHAIKWYKKYFKFSNWNEEKWYSLYGIGMCYNAIYSVIDKDKKSKFFDKTVHAYLEAYNFHPTRNENLVKLANFYRTESKNKLCYAFAKIASQIEYPKNEALFIEKHCYTYSPKYEMSISGYYDPATRRESFEYTDSLTRMKEVPEQVRENCHSNLFFHLAKYSNEVDMVDRVFHPDIKLPYIKDDEPALGYYHPTNPSIIKYKDGYLANIRTVNYIQQKLRYYFADGTGIVRTKNYLCLLDRNFNLISQRHIRNPENKGQYSETITGYEDIRIFENDNQIWFTTTVVSSAGQPKIMLCRIPELNFKSKEDIIIKEAYYFDKTSQNVEKNWLPYSYKGKIRIIYNHFPHDIFEINNGRIDIVKKYKYDQLLNKFRGSAGPIKFGDGYLSIVHQTIYKPDSATYISRWVKYDYQMIVTHISLPFFFANKGVEFCCGLCHAQEKDHVIVALGIEDQDFRFIRYDTRLIESCLTIKIDKSIKD